MVIIVAREPLVVMLSNLFPKLEMKNYYKMKTKKKQDTVSTIQKTGLTDFSSFLIWSGLEKGITCGCDDYGALENHFPVY